MAPNQGKRLWRDCRPTCHQRPTEDVSRIQAPAQDTARMAPNQVKAPMVGLPTNVLSKTNGGCLAYPERSAGYREPASDDGKEAPQFIGCKGSMPRRETMQVAGTPIPSTKDTRRANNPAWHPFCPMESGISGQRPLTRR